MAIKKDFYNVVPGGIASELDKIIEQYECEPWFAKAWDGYRIHILNSKKDKIMAPHLFFDKFIRVPNESVEEVCEECKLDYENTVEAEPDSLEELAFSDSLEEPSFDSNDILEEEE